MSVYTASEAAKLCGVSTRTVQRKIEQLEQAGAWKDATGYWQIPLDAMRAVGLSPGRPAAPDKSLRQPDMSGTTVVEQMRAELAELRRRAEVAEALAAERERIIDAQALTLKMLTAAPAPAPQTPAGEPLSVSGRLARLLRL